LGLGVAPGAADGHQRLAVQHDDGGVGRQPRTLPGGQGGRVVRLHPGLAAAARYPEAQAGDHRGPERGVAGGGGKQVALAIHHGHVTGIPFQRFIRCPVVIHVDGAGAPGAAAGLIPPRVARLRHAARPSGKCRWIDPTYPPSSLHTSSSQYLSMPPSVWLRIRCSWPRLRSHTSPGPRSSTPSASATTLASGNGRLRTRLTVARGYTSMATRTPTSAA